MSGEWLKYCSSGHWTLRHKIYKTPHYYILSMEIKFSKEKIQLRKELNALDRFVLDFTSILNKLKIKYVLVSGYVSILFGRSRSSEDIDLIIQKLEYDDFVKLWNVLIKNFECIITENIDEAYKDYLLSGISLRFSRKGEYIPNMEIKFPKDELDVWTLGSRKEVLLNGNQIYISPLELQIPFKLFLGSEKDIEDAKHLYNLFKDDIDGVALKEFNRKLKIEALFNRYLR